MKWHETPEWRAVVKRIGEWDSFLVHVLCKVKIQNCDYTTGQNLKPVGTESPAWDAYRSWACH
jgi:hypothetical protein